jgi:hypothetical protein
MAANLHLPTDEEIQRDILEECQWDTRHQPNEIGVSVKNGIVTLHGWVDSYTKSWQPRMPPTGFVGSEWEVKPLVASEGG